MVKKYYEFDIQCVYTVVLLLFYLTSSETVKIANVLLTLYFFIIIVLTNIT